MLKKSIFLLTLLIFLVSCNDNVLLNNDISTTKEVETTQLEKTIHLIYEEYDVDRILHTYQYNKDLDLYAVYFSTTNPGFSAECIYTIKDYIFSLSQSNFVIALSIDDTLYTLKEAYLNGVINLNDVKIIHNEHSKYYEGSNTVTFEIDGEPIL